MNYANVSYLPTPAGSYQLSHHSGDSLDAIISHYTSSISSSSVEVINLDRTLDQHVVRNIDNDIPNKYTSSPQTHQQPKQYGQLLAAAYGTLGSKASAVLSDYNPSFQQSRRHYHVVDHFLNIYRHPTPFIGKAEAIKEYIRKAFTATTGMSLPDDISIRICTAEELKKVHSNFSNAWSNGIQGFSLNKTRELFVKEGDLDRVMLVIGHEIGHVLSNTLDDKHDEEAKAFAFECAWMEAIVKHNIANLKESINLDFIPANNGLHDIAFGFVRNIIQAGKKALTLFQELIRGEMKVNLNS